MSRVGNGSKSLSSRIRRTKRVFPLPVGPVSKIVAGCLKWSLKLVIEERKDVQLTELNKWSIWKKEDFTQDDRMRRYECGAMRHLKLKDIIRHFEAIQVIYILLILVGARVPINSCLYLDELVAAGGSPVARHGWRKRRVFVFSVVDLRRSVEGSSKCGWSNSSSEE